MKKTLLAAAGVILAGSIASAQSAGDIIITEWQANPSDTSDADGEYVELYNTTGSPIDIDGWELKDDGSDSATFSGATIIPANGFLLVGASATLGSCGIAVDVNWDTIGGYTLANGGDEIVLETPANVEICRVTYTNGDPDGAGAQELDDIATPVAGVAAPSSYDALSGAYCSGTDTGSPGSFGGTLPVELDTFSVD